MNWFPELRQTLAQRQTRRVFLGRTAQGLGSLALASLINPGLLRAATAASDRWKGVVSPLHYPATAKRVIWLTMAGGPKVHPVGEAFEVVSKLELPHVPSVRGDELDRRPRTRADRGLVLHVFGFLQGTLGAKVLNRLGAGPLDLHSRVGSRGLRHAASLIDCLHGLET